jgi:uncharacterized integral membrane protein
MRRGNRTSLVFGILLIFAGILFILIRSNPVWQDWFVEVWDWPLTIVALGGFLFLLGLILWEPGMAIPAVIVSGIGLIIYYQVQTDDWTSWIYLWTLTPGFTGIGIILASIMEMNWRHIWRGLDLVLISGLLYVLFASLFGGMTLLGPYGPAILMISLGIYVLIRGAVSMRRKKQME